MKVAIFTDTFLPSVNGVVRATCNLIKGLKKKGIEVVVFAPSKKTHMKYYENARVYYFASKELKFYPEHYSVKVTELLKGIGLLIKMEDPDVFHVQDPFQLGLVGLYYAKKFKKPAIATFHTFFEKYVSHLTKGRYRELLENTVGKLSWQYFKLFFTKCDKTIALGKEIKKVLEGHGIKNTVIIPNPFDYKNFVKKKSKIKIRKRYKIPKDKKILLYVGRVSFEKRIDVLLKAFKEIDGKAFLLIVGKGPKLKEYKNLAKRMKLKNVIFAGFVPDDELPNYYEQCDIFVSPSDTEILPYVVIEALAFGKPVIGPDMMGIKDLVISNYNGLLFKAGAYINLAEKLKILINDNEKIKIFGKNAKEYIKRYDIEEVTEKMINLYDKVKFKNKKFSFHKLFKNINKLLK